MCEKIKEITSAPEQAFLSRARFNPGRVQEAIEITGRSLRNTFDNDAADHRRTDISHEYRTLLAIRMGNLRRRRDRLVALRSRADASIASGATMTLSRSDLALISHGWALLATHTPGKGAPIAVEPASVEPKSGPTSPTDTGPRLRIIDGGHPPPGETASSA